MEHYIEVTLWLPKDDTLQGISDTLITPAKTLWRGKLHFYNGTAAWTGDWSALPPSRYSVQTLSQVKRMVWDSIDIHIDVPQGISLDDVELYIESHAGINETAFAEAQLAESDNRAAQDQLAIQVFPNPASPQNAMNLAVSSPQTNPLTIRLFNGDGALNAILFQGNVEAGVLHTTTIPASTLTAGTYFATFQVGSEVYVKRFLVQ